MAVDLDKFYKNTTPSNPRVTEKQKGDKIVEDEVFKEMLSVLNDLTGHTHVFYDDYSTACNCNCNCTCCVRGMVW